jgi:hypothetical protein
MSPETLDLKTLPTDTIERDAVRRADDIHGLITIIFIKFINCLIKFSKRIPAQCLHEFLPPA